MKLNLFSNKKTAKVSPEDKPETVSKETKAVELKGNAFSYQSIISPYVTEKTSALNAGDQYAFKVFRDANKIEIKKAIEGLYGVHVEKVRILVMPGKERRLGRFEGEKAGFKKAIVRLRQGEKIEVAAH